MTMIGYEFLHPWYLALLLFLPVFAWLRGRRGGAAAVQFSMTSRMLPFARRTAKARGYILAGLMLAGLSLMVIALARPRVILDGGEVKSSGIDIMLVLDVSRSMLAEDFTIGGRRANRVETVKKVTEEFISRRKSDRIGIVAFAGRPYLVSPLTLDHDWLIKNLQRIEIGLVEDGTAIGSAISIAAARLKDTGAKTRIMLLLTDGENNAGKIDPKTAAEAAAALGIRIYAIGAGSRGSAPYPFQDAFGRIFYRNVPAEFDEKTLQEISALSGGKYFRATDTKSLENIYQTIDKLEKAEITVTTWREVTELYSWPLSFGLVLLVLRFFLAETILRRLP